MTNPTIICFGEVLWDLLPSGRIAGGAPMNVAFHANQLGMESKMISKVGDDELGEELKHFLKNIGVSIELIQSDNKFPTGTVNVTLATGGIPSYEIVSPVAWDDIHPEDAARKYVKNGVALVFGSLACRTEQNKKTLLEYLKLAHVRVFDVNFRAPFYSQALIEELMAKTDIVKMNDEEFEIIAGWQGAVGDDKSRLETIKNKFGLDAIILTRGKEGAACLNESGYHEQPGIPVQVQDTIGSGDSFLAAFLSKYLPGENTSNCLAFAAAVGAMVATKKGGTPVIDDHEIQTLLNKAILQKS